MKAVGNIASISLQKYFKRNTGVQPYKLAQADSTKLVSLYFATEGLALLDSLEQINVHEFIEFIYSHQILPIGPHDNKAGFRGSNTIACSADPEIVQKNRSVYDCSHVTMVYAALCLLLSLGDNLSRVNRLGILSGIKALECIDEPGLFKASLVSSERDMRFVFSAVASCYILNGLDYINCENITKFISRCFTYEGGFAQLPGLEAHAGATYCALASLKLISKLDLLFPPQSRQRDRIIKWLIHLQTQGFSGRTGKPNDTCYTFWVCASLKILNCAHLIERDSVLRFVISCWDEHLGAIKKLPSFGFPDVLHSYLGLSGLSCLYAGTENNIITKSDHCNYEKQNSNTTTTTFYDPNNNNNNNSENRDSHLFSSNQLNFNQEIYESLYNLLISDQMNVINPELNIPQTAVNYMKQLHNEWENIQ